MKIVARDVPPRTAWALEQAGVHPLLARLYRGARRAGARTNSTTAWRACCRPARLRGAREAAALLADAIARRQAALHRRRLRLRRRHRLRGRACAACACSAREHVELPRARPRGRRLRPDAADRRARRRDSGADLLITVDNGIASVEGVAAARGARPAVLVTDHHLPRRPDRCPTPT